MIKEERAKIARENGAKSKRQKAETGFEVNTLVLRQILGTNERRNLQNVISFGITQETLQTRDLPVGVTKERPVATKGNAN